MSKYDKDTKFYWLMLKEDYFDEDAITWLEEQGPNGRDYAYFYLKLCAKSLSTNGILMRKVGKVFVPYDCQRLAEITRMPFDIVKTAMELLQQIGLVEILENGAIYLPQIENLIGSQSKGAFKKQQQRALNCKSGHLSTQSLPECPPNLESKSKNIEDRLIDNKLIYLLNSDNFFEEINFVQDETEIYNDAFKNKGVYINRDILDIRKLDKKIILQIMLSQELIKYVIDKKLANIYEQINEIITEKVFGRMLDQDKIDTPISYFITSFQNEVNKNG